MKDRKGETALIYIYASQPPSFATKYANNILNTYFTQRTSLTFTKFPCEVETR